MGLSNRWETRGISGTFFPQSGLLSWYATGYPEPLTCRVEIEKLLKTYNTCSGEIQFRLPEPDFGDDFYTTRLTFTVSNGITSKTLTYNLKVVRPYQPPPGDVGPKPKPPGGGY